MAVTMRSTATCGTRFRMTSMKPSPRTDSLVNFSCRTRITRLLVNRRLSCLYGEPTLLRLDGEPSSGCDSSVSVLEGAVVVGGISVATPSAVMRRSLTVSLLRLIEAPTRQSAGTRSGRRLAAQRSSCRTPRRASRDPAATSKRLQPLSPRGAPAGQVPCGGLLQFR
jgi:hypothetical protein